MLDLKQAMDVVYEKIPNGAIHKATKYKNFYIFTVYYDDAFDGMMDPYYTVDMKTGKFKELVMGRDMTPLEVARAFQNEINLSEPEKQMQHSGVMGMKWGVRR